MPFGFHPAYLVVLLIIVLIIFGPGKLPDLGNAVGKSIREFRKASSDIQDQIKDAVDHRSAPEADAEPASANGRPHEAERTEAARPDAKSEGKTDQDQKS